MKLCGFEAGPDRPFFLIAGPCVVESEGLVLDIAGRMQEITTALRIPYVFKASYDKANRTSVKSFRGLGVKDGCAVLAAIGKELGVPVTTDIHSPEEAAIAAKMIASAPVGNTALNTVRPLPSARAWNASRRCPANWVAHTPKARVSAPATRSRTTPPTSCNTSPAIRVR